MQDKQLRMKPAKNPLSFFTAAAIAAAAEAAAAPQSKLNNVFA